MAQQVNSTASQGVHGRILKMGLSPNHRTLYAHRLDPPEAFHKAERMARLVARGTVPHGVALALCIEEAAKHRIDVPTLALKTYYLGLSTRLGYYLSELSSGIGGRRTRAENLIERMALQSANDRRPVKHILALAHGINRRHGQELTDDEVELIVRNGMAPWLGLRRA